jgi:hypothetical protein
MCWTGTPAEPGSTVVLTIDLRIQQEPQQSDRSGPESPGRRAANCGGGVFGSVCGHEHRINKRHEHDNCSQGSEKKDEASFHRFSPIIQQRIGFVLEKIDLPDQRRVVLKHASTALTNKVRRAQVREGSEVVNQMRLVVIPAIHRHSPPVWHSLVPHCFLLKMA